MLRAVPKAQQFASLIPHGALPTILKPLWRRIDVATPISQLPAPRTADKHVSLLRTVSRSDLLTLHRKRGSDFATSVLQTNFVSKLVVRVLQGFDHTIVVGCYHLGRAEVANESSDKFFQLAFELARSSGNCFANLLAVA